MAELSTLARPYARAAFEYARGKSAMDSWSSALATAAAVSVSERVANRLSSPAHTAEQLAELMIEICGDELDADQRNFIKVLASNKRLPLLGEISELFEKHKAEHERSVDVTVASAYPLDESAQQTLAQVLSKKLEREVKVETQVDEYLALIQELAQ